MLLSRTEALPLGAWGMIQLLLAQPPDPAESLQGEIQPFPGSSQEHLLISLYPFPSPDLAAGEGPRCPAARWREHFQHLPSAAGGAGYGREVGVRLPQPQAVQGFPLYTQIPSINGVLRPPDERW